VQKECKLHQTRSNFRIAVTGLVHKNKFHFFPFISMQKNLLEKSVKLFRLGSCKCALYDVFDDDDDLCLLNDVFSD